MIILSIKSKRILKLSGQVTRNIFPERETPPTLVNHTSSSLYFVFDRNMTFDSSELTDTFLADIIIQCMSSQHLVNQVKIIAIIHLLLRLIGYNRSDIQQFPNFTKV